MKPELIDSKIQQDAVDILKWLVGGCYDKSDPF